MEISGKIHSVETFGALDGPGIRYVIFFQGCPLRCLYCHNPDAWKMGDGRTVTARSMVEDIMTYREFLKDGGVTLSGGEPMMQPVFAEAILSGVKAQGLHTAVDTSGAVPLYKCRSVLESTDLVLLDIKAADAELCRKITGQDNGNALEILRFCEKNGIDVWIRQVIVPGLTATDAQVSALGELLKPFKCIKKAELLPFHKMGEFKWAELDEKYELGETQPPSDEQMTHFRQLLKETIGRDLL